ncbi:GOLPH3/VPS74 family protein [Kitasatospora azatica]|uniref:GOLPH3/VPS74 family protein n=1 Tax=Kitasatospora azatica TaxID=58347 RepID=UPI00056BDAC5|nr:GPP34 family phosphoprotein [Kitasatospora azatica]
MIAHPRTLPGKLYLLSYDPEKGRISGRLNLELLLGAAALTELFQRGLLRDVKGKAIATGPAPADLVPLLAQLLAEIAESRPRSWKYWVARRRGLVRTLPQALAATGVLRVEQYRVLGLFPATRVEPRDPRPRKALTAAFATALRGPLSRVEPADAALVALADAAQLRVVLTFGQRREHRERIRQLAAHCGPVPAALRAAIRDRNSEG